MSIAYIGLGSNLSNPVKQVHQAIDQIKLLEQSSVTKLSSLYFSKPMGPQDQPDYINAVLSLNTSLSPIELLDSLQQIENFAGRIRKDERWGARVLDLDILLFDNLIINSERLVVPHYGLKLREFVLIPLSEISPNLTLPDGEKVSSLAKHIKSNELKIHSQLN